MIDSKVSILGREPALWLAFLSAAVKVLCATVVHVTQTQQGVINTGLAVGVGLLVAVVVHDGVVAAATGFCQGVLALVVAFGWHASADLQATIMSFVGIALAMFVRQQVTAPTPAPAPGGAGGPVVELV